MKVLNSTSKYHVNIWFLTHMANISVQLLRNRLVATARKSMSQNASLSQVYGSMQDVYQQMQTPLVYQQQSVRRVRVLLPKT